MFERYYKTRAGATIMMIKIRIGNFRFTWTFTQVTEVIGVDSTLPEGDHIIMWDLDDVPFNLVHDVLQQVQWIYGLPNIYILNTGKPDNYIAYCFKAVYWRDSVKIVAATPYVDYKFFKYGVYREHWTLRVTPKEGRKPRLATILHSTVPEDCSISELNKWVKDMPNSRGVSFLSPYAYRIECNYPLTCPPVI